MMKKVCDIFGISIYLESDGHGMSVADGIWATVKSIIRELLSYNEGEAIRARII